MIDPCPSAPPAASTPAPRNIAAAMGELLARASQADETPLLSPRAALQAEQRQRDQAAADAAIRRLREAKSKVPAPEPVASPPIAAPPAASTAAEPVDQADQVMRSRAEFERWELAEFVRVRQARDAQRAEVSS